MANMKHRHRVFVQEYCKTLNASEAARRAGYKTRANVAGQRLLTKDDIKNEISRILNSFREAEQPAMREAVIKLWQTVMSGGEGVTTRDRLKASELLAKCSGLFAERVEISAASELTIKWPELTLPLTARE